MFQIVDLLVHVVGGLDDLRVGFIGALRDDQVNELLHDAHVGLFGVALQQSTQTFLPLRDWRRPACRKRRWVIEVLSKAVQPGRILKAGDLNLAGFGELVCPGCK